MLAMLEVVLHHFLLPSEPVYSEVFLLRKIIMMTEMMVVGRGRTDGSLSLGKCVTGFLESSLDDRELHCLPMHGMYVCTYSYIMVRVVPYETATSFLGQ